MKECLLAHCNERKSAVTMLVLHATAHSAAEAIECLDKLELSSHYVLDFDGEIFKLVDERQRAWHTGVAFWRGVGEDLNSCSVGIEICNRSLGQEPFSEEQIAKLIPFCQKIMRKYQIDPRNVVGHSDIAPDRKPDPGLAFPWKRLAKEGIGLWYQPKNAEKMPENDIVALLSLIGYDTRDEHKIKSSAYAFCRHFLPEFVEIDEDVAHLVEHHLPQDYAFIQEDKFLKTLKAVAYSYR